MTRPQTCSHPIYVCSLHILFIKDGGGSPLVKTSGVE